MAIKQIIQAILFPFQKNLLALLCSMDSDGENELKRQYQLAPGGHLNMTILETRNRDQHIWFMNFICMI